MNTKFQNALNLKEQKVPPIWMMRQAGRYQKTYRALREEHSFERLCKEPELSAQVGLNAVLEFDFDLCILFSDILFPLEALGMGLSYDPKPNLSWKLDTKEDFKKFKEIDEAVSFMSFQSDALKATRSVLPKDKSLIGFVGGYWTLFGYAVEGSHKGSMLETKKRRDLFSDFIKDYMHPLIKKNIELQLNSGAELVMIFDTALGEVDVPFYKKEIFPFIKDLAKSFPNKLGYYTKGTTGDYFFDEFYNLPFLGMGWDHRWDLTKVLKQKKYKGFVQGNFDQALLHQRPQDFKVSLKNYLDQFKDLSTDDLKGLVLGLGHGVLPKTPEDNVKAFMDIARDCFDKR
jgi:uroporphyrinogen decarboxylase